MRKTKKIVLSGAAGSGKTSVILELERRGLHVEHEVIRDHTALLLNDKEGVFENPLEALDDPIPFNETLLNLRLNKLLSQGAEPTFFDRGIVDVLAYMDHFNQEYPRQFVDICTINRYDKLYYFEPWEAIYSNDVTRLETFKSVLLIDKVLKNSYSYFGYEINIVPQTTVESRADFILKTLED